MSVRSLVLALGVLSVGSVSAIAADLPVKAPIAVAPALYNWTGCYIGIEGGYKWGKSQHRFEDVGGITRDITDKFNIDGGLAGGTVGCNYQWPSTRWVIGIEGDWSWTDVKGGAFDLAPFFNPAFFSETEEKWLATFRGRVGWAFGATGNVLLYVTGGAAVADIQINTDGPRPASVFFGSESKTRWGWTAGIGIEWAFLPHWSVKGEYLYVDFGDDSYYCPVPPVGFVNRCSGVDVTQNIVRLGLNYKF